MEKHQHQIKMSELREQEAARQVEIASLRVAIGRKEQQILRYKHQMCTLAVEHQKKLEGAQQRLEAGGSIQ